MAEMATSKRRRRPRTPPRIETQVGVDASGHLVAERWLQVEDPEFLGVLEELRDAFREKFGRDPGPDDPVIFDPDADEPRPYPEGRLEAQIVKAMHEAGMDPAFVYAFKKTGMLVTEDNADLWAHHQLEEWEGALDEFSGGSGPLGPRRLDELVRYVAAALAVDALDALVDDWPCDGSLRHTLEWAALAGVAPQDLREQLDALGGSCDCEVVMSIGVPDEE